MHVLLAIIVLAVCLWLASRAIRDSRGGAWAGPRTPSVRSRGALRSQGVPKAARSGAGRSVLAALANPGSSATRAKARADIATTWHKAMAANWLEMQRYQRKNGTASGPPAVTKGGTATATAARPTIRQRLRLAPFTPAAQEPAGNGTAPQAGNGTNGTSQQNQPAVQGNGGPPARQVPPPPAQAPPPSTNGGTTVAAPSTAGAEQLIEGINRIHAEAAAGGIRHKQAALKAMHEAMIRFAGMLQMVARTMSEPGSNYGPEITEPLGQAAQHLQAGAMNTGESDSALTSLIHMTVGELADSPRQAPHNSELSETGGVPVRYVHSGYGGAG